MLSPYTVLDCSGRSGWLAGRILADLGADVVKVERPETDLSGPDWQAFNVGKRLLLLDFADEAGRAQLDGLLTNVDFLVESAVPGSDERLIFDHARLIAANPALIQVSITPFGLTGPRAGWLASDIELMAAGGVMSLAGRPGEVPLRVGVAQSHSWVGAHAAAGAMTALAHRRATGLGQQVDASAQAAVISAASNAPPYADIGDAPPTRSGEFIPGRSLTGARFRVFWPCQDGYLNFIFYGGNAGRRTNERLVEWMHERGVDCGMLDGIDWAGFDLKVLSQDDVDALEAPVGAFFAALSKREFLEEASRREMLGYPVSTVEDIAGDPQLAARDFWQIAKSNDGSRRRFCGDFVVVDGARAALGDCGRSNQAEAGAVAGDFAAARRKLAAIDAARDASQALAGLKVVEFGGYAAGPQIGKFLANFGATVVHVESRKRPDGFRLEYPPYKDGKQGLNTGGTFAAFNDSKNGAVLDLKNPKGLELAGNLVAWSDLVIENMRPGVMERLGLGYAEVKKSNPGLVMLSTCNMGQTGPRANTPGFGSQLSALAGFCGATGFADGPPMLLFGPYIDFIASAMGTAAVLAALDRSAREGRGCWIDQSQYESGLHFMAGALFDLELHGRVHERAGNADAQAAPHNAYACRDGADGMEAWLALSCWSDAEFASLAEVMEGAEIAADKCFASAAARRQNAARLDKIIAAWCAGQDANAAAETLQAADVHAYPVNATGDLFSDPQLVHRRIWRTRRHPEIGEHRYNFTPYDLSAAPGEITAPAPCLGEHNFKVFTEFLGLTPEEYGEFEKQGAFD